MFTKSPTAANGPCEHYNCQGLPRFQITSEATVLLTLYSGEHTNGSSGKISSDAAIVSLSFSAHCEFIALFLYTVSWCFLVISVKGVEKDNVHGSIITPRVRVDKFISAHTRVIGLLGDGRKPNGRRICKAVAV